MTITDLYAAAVAARPATFPHSRADSAAYRAARDELQAAWAKAHGLRRSNRRHRCMVALTDTPRTHAFRCEHCHATPTNILDHVTLWNRDGRPAVLVSQPYPSELSPAGLAWLEDHTSALGLVYSITDEPSWWCPGWTKFVVITRAPSNVVRLRPRRR